MQSAGDVVLRVTAGAELIARMDVYWYAIKVDGTPLEVAWVDHLHVEETYNNLGLGSALFAVAAIVGGREREWGVGYSMQDGWFEKFGWFRPDDATDHLIVGSLTGQSQAWPPGRIEVGTPE